MVRLSGDMDDTALSLILANSGEAVEQPEQSGVFFGVDAG